MNPKRKKQQDFIINWISKIVPNIDHKSVYMKFFDTMTDSEFSKWMQDIYEEKKNLVCFIPNLADSGVSVENNVLVAKELGIDFFQQLWIQDDETGRVRLTPVPYMVLQLPYRKAAQTVLKKSSIPPNMKTVDATSGQPTGDSKGARMSLPEVNIAMAMGLDNLTLEYMKYRGGDLGGYAAMNAMLAKTGSTNMASLKQFSTKVESIKTMNILLTCALLKSNL